MAQLDPSTLLPNDHIKQAVAAGEITQLTRGQSYAAVGDTFELEGKTFELTEIVDRTLGDLTDEDAVREGSADLEAYKERMVRAHGGNFEWNDDAEVVTHRFESQAA